MPALNVEFSDQELEELRALAQERGISMKALIREATADQITRHRALREASEIFQATFHNPDLAAAIEAAGIDDGPVSRASGRAA
ncbi:MULTISPECIES: ribbon-helix-helix protein, CopG family [Streptomyces]